MLRSRTVCLAYVIFVWITASSSHGQLPLAKFWCKLSISCQVMFLTSHLQCSQPWWFAKGLAIWLLRGGGGVWVISETNILQPDLREKKILQGNTWGKKISSTEKKYVSWSIVLEKQILQRYKSGKKFYLQKFGQKKFLPQPNHPYHPLPPPKKVKCLTPKAFAVNDGWWRSGFARTRIGIYSKIRVEGSFLLEERIYFCVLPTGFGSIQSH